MSKERFIDDFLNDIIDSINDIKDFTKDMTREAFVVDRKTRQAVAKSIEDIGIAISEHIPESIYENYPEIPWSAWRGMRNILAHQYFGIDWDQVWQTVTEDLDPIQKTAEQILRDIHLGKFRTPGD